MKLLRLRDPYLTVLFEDEEIVVFDKPYGINAHTNDAKSGNEDYLVPGAIEILETQLEQKLFIVHRLDRTTTGVIVYAKTEDAAKKYQAYFRNREAKKRYLFLTRDRSKKTEYTCSEPILHKGSTLEAETEFKLVKNHPRFQLWEAKPFSGRNHQIRVHSANVGIPILGDSKYGGAEFPFLCLHHQRIEFPNGLVLESKVPRYFDDLGLLESQELIKCLFEIDRRERIFLGKSRVESNSQSEKAVRLIHLRGGLEDREFTLDFFGKYLILNWSKDGSKNKPVDNQTADIFRRISSELGIPVLVKNRTSNVVELIEHLGEEILSIETVSEPLTIRENELKYELRASSGPSSGLYLDQRPSRNWIFENSRNAKALNLFASTCSSSVAAMKGGALEVTSVESGKTYLNWGKRNFEINDLDVSKAQFLCRDSLQFLDQCRAKERKYDLIICTPPFFYRGEKRTFKIDLHLERLIEDCFSCLTPGGSLVLTVNVYHLLVSDLRSRILQASKKIKREITDISSIQPTLDFELPGSRSFSKSLLIRL